MDEPTVGLDPMQIIEIRDLIKELARKHTVIISSHILSEISEVCDTVMIINKGKLVVMDRVENLPKYLERSMRLKLLVLGDEAKIEAALSSINGIEELTFDRGEDGLTAIFIGTKGSLDVREEVFYALASARCPIYSMNMDSLSLEDIFLEMTKNNVNSMKVQSEENLQNMENDMQEQILDEDGADEREEE